MSNIGAASGAAVSSARAAASRANGARSCGPKTPAGKARASRNALKHGLRAARHVVLPDEDAAAFAALEAALAAELAPADTLAALLVGRIARAAWRLERAERLEVDLFAERLRRASDGGVGLALIRDGYSTRSFETVLRYRAAAQAEFLRALKTLQALRAAARPARAAAPTLAEAPTPVGAAQAAADQPGAAVATRAARPNQPEQPAAPANRPNEPEAGRRLLPPRPYDADLAEADRKLPERGMS